MTENKQETILMESVRFGRLEVPKDSIIEFPNGMIGFPQFNKFVMLEHKEPFSWLHSVEEPSLAFVVVDGFALGEEYDKAVAFKEAPCEFKDDDEYAILIIVTVRPSPAPTTANIKAPLFVNVRNRKGVQVVYDEPRYSTRFPLISNTPTSSGQKNNQEQSSQDQPSSPVNSSEENLNNPSQVDNG